ncbi:MAG: hypothetical protein M0R46_17605 [Candidatus Muirbacterium halophilum]|nr:hypothetical protein [Candidatus Muirbacterium halophilum]
MQFSNQELTLSELIKHNHIKFNDTKDFFNKIDSILELIKKDVFLLSRKKKVVFSDFDYFFEESKKQIKVTLNKRSKAFTKIFNCGNIAKAAEFLARRILSNMRNFSTDKNYKKYTYISSVIEYEDYISDFDNDYHQVDIESDLERLNPVQLSEGLKKIYPFLGTFEFENLCKKYQLDPQKVMGFNPSEMPEIEVCRSASGNDQLAFAFAF